MIPPGALIIAEKPSVARAIREALGRGNYEVTHCFGHLFELSPPEAYNPDLKRWSMSSLPIRVRSWRRKVRHDAKDQFKAIVKALASAKVVIHAGDPDREGQLLVDEVLEEAGWKGRTLRVLLSATDPRSVKKAFERLEPNEKYQPLSRSALARQRADWLVGMNMTRAVTKGLADGPLVSIGRVQTPTLALVVRRQREIDRFVPQTFFTMRGSFMAAGCSEPLAMKAEPAPLVTDPRIAAALAKAVTGRACALEWTREAAIRRAPLPFDLPSFQKAAEQFYGWTVSRSLEALQAAYEARLTTYPRSDCRYLPAEQADDAVPIAVAVAARAAGGVASGLMLSSLAPSRRVFDSSKVEEHHAIIPTGVVPASTDATDALKAWRLVSLQFIASLLPDMQVEIVKARAVVPTGGRSITELEFKTQAEFRVADGFVWRDLDFRLALGLPKKDPAKGEAGDMPQRLPRGYCDGLAVTLQSCEPVQGTTTPPAPYTEASLISDMKAVAKYVADEQHKAVLKESAGLGTAATQAAIIETLKTRGFIETRKAGRAEKSTIHPTQLGEQVIDAIPQEMTDPVNTAVWEQTLKLIAHGQADADGFVASVEATVDRWVEKVRHLHANSARRITATPAPPAAGRRANSAKGRFSKKQPKVGRN